jgi:hypothetical protein
MKRVTAAYLHPHVQYVREFCYPICKQTKRWADTDLVWSVVV